MGHYIDVDHKVRLFAEDLNPQGKKPLFFYMAGRQIIICLNTS